MGTARLDRGDRKRWACPSQEPVRIGAVDVEAFSRNLARVIEEGGRALAAYLKPREQGQGNANWPKSSTRSPRRSAKSHDYWLADPKRALELQTRFGKAYLDLWASAAKRLAGEPATPVASPAPNDRRFNDPEWTSNQFFDFLKQLYLLSTRLGQSARQRSQGPRPAYQAEGRILRAADRQRGLAVEFRSDQSGIAARDDHQQCGKSCARHAHAGRRHPGGRRRSENTPVRLLDVRGRPQPGGHARQSDLPERPHAAHPVRAFDRKGAEEAAADRAALDQQVLHARPDAGKIVHQVVRRPGHHRLLHLLGQSGRPPRPKKLRRVYARGPARGARRHQAGDRRRRGARHRLLRRRHAAGHCARLHGGAAATSASSRRPCSPPRSTSPMRAT